MLDDLVRQLNENNEKLIQLRSDLDMAIQKNKEIISEIEAQLVKKDPQMLEDNSLSITEKTDDKGLKTLERIWEENTEDIVIVRKPKWTRGFCFVVNAVDNKQALGTSYKLDEDGKVFVHQEKKKYPADKPFFCLLSQSEKSLKEDIITFINSEDLFASSFEEKDTISEEDPCHKLHRPGICVGSSVKLLDCDTGKVLEYVIVPSHSKVTYKTMGYRTKNYADIELVSEADGFNSISDSSPVGAALIGKHEGEEVTVEIENNTVKHYKILLVSL